jgi:hypothetical protein
MRQRRALAGTVLCLVFLTAGWSVLRSGSVGSGSGRPAASPSRGQLPAAAAPHRRPRDGEPVRRADNDDVAPARQHDRSVRGGGGGGDRGGGGRETPCPSLPPPPPLPLWSAVDGNELRSSGFRGAGGPDAPVAARERAQWVAPPDNAGWRDPAPRFPLDSVGVYWVFKGHELRWIPEVVLARIGAVCGRGIVFRQPDEFWADFAGLAGGGGGPPPFPYVVLIVGSEHFPAELRGGSGGGGDDGRSPQPRLPPALAAYLAARATLVHLGDEFDSHDAVTASYGLFGSVFRNYVCDDPARGVSGEYLKLPLDADDGAAAAAEEEDGAGRPMPPRPRRRWFPLGASPNMLAASAWRPRVADRPLLFFWSGSTGGKPERRDLLDALAGAPDLEPRGFVHAYVNFEHDMGAPHVLHAGPYSRAMHSAIVALAPSGASADQFRISEAFEAAAIPLVRRGHKALSYLDSLGFNYLAVDEFAEVPALLRHIDEDAGAREQLEAWAAHNSELWDHVKQRVATQLAYDVCRAAPA